MSTLSLIFLVIGFLFVVGVPILMYIHQRTYINPLKKSIEWQFTKARKLGEGWLPPAYTDFDSEEERDATIRALLSEDERTRQ